MNTEVSDLLDQLTKKFVDAGYKLIDKPTFRPSWFIHKVDFGLAKDKEVFVYRKEIGRREWFFSPEVVTNRLLDTALVSLTSVSQ